LRILVTGGAGYIGSVMSHMLVGEGHEVLILDNLSMGHAEAVEGIDLKVLELEDRASVREACEQFKPDACMHFAAHSLVGESMENPYKYLSGNLGGSLNLLGGLLKTGCRLIVFSSTCAVYGVPHDIPITERSLTDPINPYGWSKLMFEKVLELVSRTGAMRFFSLRYFNAAGADAVRNLGEDHDPETHLIPRVIRAALGSEPAASIYGTDYATPDGTCVRDYIHVVDLCHAHLLALERLTSGGGSGAFNLGNGDGFSVRKVIESVKRVSGADFDVVEEERREGDPPVLVASSEKIRSELGWEPGITGIDEVVRTAWEWHRAHPGGYA